MQTFHLPYREMDKGYLHISEKVRTRRITIVSTRRSKGNSLVALTAVDLRFVERQLYVDINMAAKPALV